MYSEQNKGTTRRHSHQLELESYKRSTQGCILPTEFIKLTNCFNTLALQLYKRTLYSIDQSVTELKKPEDFEIKCCPELGAFESLEERKEQLDKNYGRSFKMIDTFSDSRPQNTHEGHFRGFQKSTGNYKYTAEENRKCIELMVTACEISYERMLLDGIRCFIIDLFVGTIAENLKLIQNLKQAQIRVSKKLKFPVCTTVIAKLSPRHQYTGYLVPWDAVRVLNANDLITLTTNRYYSTRGDTSCIYVNARYLLNSLRVCDVLVIGEQVQVQIRSIHDQDIFCVVTRGGELRSRMPVRFPKSCNRFLLSWEEIESIAFAKEVGINVIVSYIVGTPAYVEDLKIALALLECSNMRLFARIVLNDIQGCEYDMQWVIEEFDGFLLDTSPPDPPQQKPQPLQICPNIVCFLEEAFKLKRPLLLDHYNLAKRRLVTLEENYTHIYLYPDKYIYKCDRTQCYFYFNFLQQEMIRDYSLDLLSKRPFCDDSYTGSDTLARSCVIASIEMQAKAIIVSSSLASMAKKISHFRPQAPIVLVTRTQCLMHYVMMYHNVVKLLVPVQEGDPHARLLYKEMVYALKFVQALKLLKTGDNVILVYGMYRGTKFPDKYLAYIFDAETFPMQLRYSLFR